MNNDSIMQRLLLLLVAVLFAGGLMAQPIFLEEFDSGDFQPDTDKFDFTTADGEWTVAGNGTNGPWDGVWFDLGGAKDVSSAPLLYVRVKSGSLGTVLRMDLHDGTNATNVAPIQNTLTDEYRELVYDFSSVDVGSTDLTSIVSVFFFINPGSETPFNSTVTFDYIALGEAPAGTVMSDIYQDEMDSDSSIGNFLNMVPGISYERTVNEAGDSSVVSLVGDGSNEPWNPIIYGIRPAPEYIQSSIDISENTKMFVKMRTDNPGTSVRFDAQDVDDINSNALGITRILTNEFEVYEFNFVDATQTAIAGTQCTEDNAPCPVDLTQIKELLMYVNPGTGMFIGSVDIEWISFGISLDPAGPAALLVYSDNFDNDSTNFIGGNTGLEIAERDGNLVVSGDGTNEAFGSVSYLFNEATESNDTITFAPVVLNLDTAQNKIFVRARSLNGAVSMRLDVLDTMGQTTNIAGLARVVNDEWKILEYDWTGNYGDAGYGGSPGCTEAAPCTVDNMAINQLLLYFNPGTDGSFDGTVEIDWISVGQPLEEQPVSEIGIANYSDTLVGAAAVIEGDYTGLTSSVSDDGIWTITGTGTQGDYQPFTLSFRNDDNNAQKVDAAGSGDKLFVRARARGADDVEVRIDLIDEGNFQTTLAGAANLIQESDDYSTYTYDYAGKYSDGAFSGTACPTGGAACDVDAQRLVGLNLYVTPDPDDVKLNGNIDINWISFGQEITVNVTDFAELDGMRVFPNPATNQIGVEYNLNASSEVSMSIFDGLGRRVATNNFGRQTAGNNFERIDISQLTTGTYHLQVMVNGLPVRAVTVLKR